MLQVYSLSTRDVSQLATYRHTQLLACPVKACHNPAAQQIFERATYHSTGVITDRVSNMDTAQPFDLSGMARPATLHTLPCPRSFHCEAVLLLS